MQKRQTLFVIGSSVLFAAIVAGASYFVLSGDSQDTASEQTVQSDQNPENTQQTQTTAPQSGLQVQGSNSEATREPQLPGPDQFSQYEQYADADSALFIDITTGTGEAVTTGDAAVVVYQGWLTNGELFDQSRVNEQGQIEAFTYQLGGNQVIQGWEQGIAGMKVGGKRRLIIPSTFGYGQAGKNGIPPNAMLIFDVELVQIQKQ